MKNYELVVIVGAMAYLIGRFRPIERTSFAISLHPPRAASVLFGNRAGHVLWDIAMFEVAAVWALLVGGAGIIGLLPDWKTEIPPGTQVALTMCLVLVFAGLAITFARSVVERRRRG